MPGNWKLALISVLEELTVDQYQKMLHNLRKIPCSQRTDDRVEMAQRIIECYAEDGAIAEISKVMKIIPRNDPDVQDRLRPFVDKLTNKRKKSGRKRVAGTSLVAKENYCPAGKQRRQAASSPADPLTARNPHTQLQDEPRTPICSISNIKRSRNYTVVSLQGIVEEILPVECLKIKARQDFLVRDASGCVKISMWEKDIQLLAGVCVGDAVQVSCVKIKRFRRTVGLNSTDYTTITQVPTAGKSE
ncbi:uncharacterized protein ACBR49_009955 [Aulostomus maculatus]